MEGDGVKRVGGEGQMTAVQTVCVLRGSLIPPGGQGQECGNEAGVQVGARKWSELEERLIRWAGGPWGHGGGEQVGDEGAATTSGHRTTQGSLLLLQQET